MKFTPREPPREFEVGRAGTIKLKDCGRVELEPDEQVTFVTPAGAEYDVTRKTWGFYATPSLNGRLRQFGWRAALVKNRAGRYYVFLVEGGQAAEFETYLAAEQYTVLVWLEDENALSAFERGLAERSELADALPLHCPCGGNRFSTVFRYTAPPVGEIRFSFSSAGAYRRAVSRCELCGHFVSWHTMETSALYTGEYVNANYTDDEGLRRAFERIRALAPAQSDNVGRVQRVLEFAAQAFTSESGSASQPAVLDVGSGLCVFLDRMKAAGWSCTALDPDPRAIRHARETVGVRAICGDFMTAADLGAFEAVTFNKVLEHVKDPVAMLARARACLKPGGFVYLEVPDGEAAWAEGPEREEFFIDHWHVFSAASTTLLAARAGFALHALERLREPSGKYTLRAFLV